MSAEFVEAFKRCWAAPRPAELGELVAEDAHLVQPLMPATRSRAAFEALVAQLLAVMPDLRGTTHRWAETDDGVLIEHTLEGTMYGRALRWDIVDRITLRDGRVVERVAYFDPLPLVLAVLARPRAWPAFVRMRLGRA